MGGILQPDDPNRDFAPPALYRTVDRMVASDPVVRAALMMVVLPITEATWSVSPAGPTPEDAEVAEFVRRALLEHIDWTKVVWHAMASIRYGHAVLEEFYEAVEWSLSVPAGDGMEEELPRRAYWVPAAYQPRLGRTIWRWLVDDMGCLEAVEQQRLDPRTGNQRPVQIPASQLLVVVNEQDGDNYLGTSVLRSMYRAWYTKEKLEVIDAMAKERAGVGIPVGRVPDALWQADSGEMADRLAALRANEEGYLVLNSGDADTPGMEVEMLDMRASSQADCLPSLNYHVTQILWAVLGAWQNLGQGEVGARATATVQDDPFYLGLRAIAGGLAEAVNRQVVPRLVAANYATDRLPRLSVADIQGVNIAEMADAVSKLVSSGAIVSDDAMECHLREVMGLPEKEIDDEIGDAPEPPAGDGADGGDAAPAGVEPGDVSTPSPGDMPEEGPDAPVDEQKPERPVGVREYERRRGEVVQRVSEHRRRTPSRQQTLTAERWRPLTDLEQHVMLDAIEATIEDQRKRYQSLSESAALRVAEQLAGQINSADGDISRPRELQDALVERLEQVLADVAAFGRHTVRQELAGQRGRKAKALADDPPADPGKLSGWLKRRAKASGTNITDRVLSRARAIALREGQVPRDVVTMRLADTAKSALRAEAVATVSQALSAGRRAETAEAADRGEIAYLVWSSVLDPRSCDACRSRDGAQYEPGSVDAERDYPPLYECDGQDACRCILVAVASEEVPSER